MKKVLFIAGLTLFAYLFSGVLPCKKQLLAVSGCCKERESQSGDWERNGEDFKSCKQLNEETDQDNIFDAAGLVWWDVTCR